MKKAFCILLIAILVLSPIKARAVSAESYIVIDADTGETLYESNADAKMLIASTTKIMTALVALEHGKLDDDVKIPAEAEGVEGSSMYLKAGTTMKQEQLLYGLMLASGNDAATAIAYHIAGSIEDFAKLMNDKAAELGATNTSFTNPHGLDHEQHYSTARDMAKITAAAMENEDFVRIASTKSITINGLTYTNHNKLLWNYDGILGGKTGYTMAAGRTLVSCCERDGLRLVCVTLRDPDDWDDHMNLYDRAYAEFKRVNVVDSDTEYTEIPVIAGENCTSVPVEAAETVTLLLNSEDEVEISTELPRFVYAGVSEGETAGTLSWTVNGQPGGSVELVYTESVERQDAEKKGVWDAVMEKLMGLVEYNLNRFGYYGS